MFLFSSLAALPMLIVFYYITTGYTEAYLPVLYLWVAAGFDRIWMFFQEKLPPGGRSVWQERLGHFPITVAAAAIYAAVIFVPQIREPVSADNYLPQSDNFRRDEKHIGKLLKETLPPGKIMTRWARIAFYAEREWVNIPAAMAFDEVIDLARKSGVRFFIADGTLYGMRPMLGKEIFAPLYDEELPFGIYFRTEQDYLIRGLKVYMLYTNPRSMGVVVYEIDQEAV